MQRTCKELVRNLQEMQRSFRELARNLQNNKRSIASFHATATATNAELHNQGAAMLAPLGALGYINIYIYVFLHIYLDIYMYLFIHMCIKVVWIWAERILWLFPWRTIKNHDGTQSDSDQGSGLFQKMFTHASSIQLNLISSIRLRVCRTLRVDWIELNWMNRNGMIYIYIY